MIILNDEKVAVVELLEKKFSPEALLLLDSVRVALVSLPASILAAVVHMNDDMKPCDDGEPTVIINENSEVFEMIDEHCPQVDSILIHELVHLDQIKTGRMKFANARAGTGCVVVWDGVPYEMETMEETTGSKKLMRQYFDRPWEREAFEVQSRYVAERIGGDVQELIDQYIDLTLEGIQGE